MIFISNFRYYKLKRLLKATFEIPFIYNFANAYSVLIEHLILSV